MQYLYIALLAVMLSACCPCRHLMTSTKDSVRVEIRERTEFIHDTVYRDFPLIMQSVSVRDTMSHLENRYATSDAVVHADGTLTHSLSTKPQKEPIPVETPIRYRDSIIYRDKAVTDIVQVPRELTWWQKTKMRGFWILLAVCAIAFRRWWLPVVRRFI